MSSKDAAYAGKRKADRQSALKPQKRTKIDKNANGAVEAVDNVNEVDENAHDVDKASTLSAPVCKNVHQLQVFEEEGDIFKAPSNSVLVHACNCKGSWGAGIAKAFRIVYPEACKNYVDHCKKNGRTLVGKAHLIPPMNMRPSTTSENDDAKSKGGDKGSSKHFVGCLFTSGAYGKRKDSPTAILGATKPAMEFLLDEVNDWNRKVESDDKITEVRMCKINSGLFAVPWEKTKAELESIDVSESEIKTVRVISRPE